MNPHHPEQTGCWRQSLMRCGAVVGLLVSCAGSLASSPREARELVRQGNDQYRAGDAAGALKAYEQALEADPDSMAAKFNRGVASMSAGELGAARELFRAVDASGGDPALAAAARYNLGLIESANASIGEGDVPALPDQVVQKLKGAAGLFRSSLDITPEDADAARNLELTRRRIRDVQEFIKQQQQSQQAMQDLRDQLQKNQEQQQQQAQQSQQRQQQSQKPTPQDQQQQQQASQGTQQAADQLQQLIDQSKQQQQQAQQNPDTKGGTQQQAQQQLQMEQAQKALDEARQQQQQAEQAQQKGDAKAAQQAQDQAAQKINEALQQLGSKPQDQQSDQQDSKEEPQQGEQDQGQEQQEQEQAQEQQAQEGQDQVGEGDASEQPTDERMARILDKERRDRAYRQEQLRKQMSRNAPVEKDW